MIQRLWKWLLHPPVTGPGAMLVATVPAIEGRPIQWYLGVVTGQKVTGWCPSEGRTQFHLAL